MMTSNSKRFQSLEQDRQNLTRRMFANSGTEIFGGNGFGGSAYKQSSNADKIMRISLNRTLDFSRR